MYLWWVTITRHHDYDGDTKRDVFVVAPDEEAAKKAAEEKAREPYDGTRWDVERLDEVDGHTVSVDAALAEQHEDERNTLATRARLMENELNNLLESLRLLDENLPDGICRGSVSGYFLGIKPTIERIEATLRGGDDK